jgi:ABC-2 type transport system permease protein
MNTESNAVSESPAIAPVAISPARRLYWSVRRELWESRSIYIAPLAVAAVFLFGFMINMIYLPERLRAAFALALDPMKQHKLIEQPYNFAALLIMGTTFLVAVFYCLDALHGERRDRSILFWKSLPVSDLITVVSKASIPLLVLPLLAFAITVVTQLIMLLLSTVVLLGSGLSVSTLWSHVSFFQMSLALLYHLLVVHGLWYAPIFGWLLLVSAWARRTAFLWAALPPLAIGVVEKIAFNTSHFAAMLGNLFSGGAPGAASTGDSMSMGALTAGHPLSAPSFWAGLAFAAACLAAAVRLRRNREPI